MNTITLKDIFTIKNLKAFFIHHSNFFKKFPKKFLHFIKNSILAAHNCRNLSFAKAIFSCPNCSHYIYRPVTCKSKFCSSCGKIYAEKWANKLSSQLIDKKHRHLLFTFPEEIWEYAVFNRKLLSDFSNHIHTLFKNWFKKQGVASFGLVIIIHTNGRDSSFNPHFHVILSLGGFNKNLKWKNVNFFPSNFFNNSWKYLLLKTFKEHYPDCSKVKKIISLCYKKNFFINLKGEPLKTDTKSIQYLGRYLMRPAIAEYRITKFENNEVTFWYTDVDTKEKKVLTLPLFKFMGRLIVHIAPKGFKSVRRYGFYARNIKSSIKDKIKTFLKKTLFKILPMTWRERIIKLYGRDPLICPNCSSTLELASFHHKKYGDFYYP
jgi:hypothetical protein